MGIKLGGITTFGFILLQVRVIEFLWEYLKKMPG